MSKLRLVVSASLVLLVASAAFSQDSTAFDPEACAKHCREMAAARAKGAEAREALMKQREAAWKEIEAQLQVARTSRGDKKVAALETVIEKLMAYHASMPAGMAGCPMMGGHTMAPGCCAEHTKHGAGGGTKDCCAGAMKGCCGEGHTCCKTIAAR
jgi:hypothetical protein